MATRSKGSRTLDTYSITETWRLLVKARMKELDIGVNKLAELSGVSHGLISQMLSPVKPVKASPHVAAIHEALRWPEPATSEDSVDEDPRLSEIRAGWDDLSNADQDQIMGLFRRLLPPT